MNPYSCYCLPGPARCDDVPGTCRMTRPAHRTATHDDEGTGR